MSESSRVVKVSDGADFRALGGTVRRLIHPSTVGETNLQVSTAYLSPGEEVRTHRHRPEEAYFVVQGEGEMYLEGHPRIRLRPNTAVHIPAHAVHGQRNTGDEPLVIVCALTPPLFDDVELVDVSW